MAVQTASCQHTVPPAPPPPTRTDPRHPTLGEKYKASLVWEHRDLSDTALDHGILPLSHNSSRTEPSSQGGSLSPLTFSEPLGPWRDAQTTHCTARPIRPKVHVNVDQSGYGDALSILISLLKEFHNSWLCINLYLVKTTIHLYKYVFKRLIVVKS